MAGVILTSANKIKTGLTRYDITWVSDAAGDVSGTTFAMHSGTMVAVEFIPGVGLTQPDNLYDVDLADSLGTSMFDDGAGTTIGANLSNVIAAHKVPLAGLSGVTVFRRWHPGGPVQPLVAGAGDTNSGVIRIYLVEGVI